MIFDKSKIKEFWPYLLVTILSFVTVCVWYKTGRLLYFADATYPVADPFSYIKEYAYGWKNHSGGIVDSTGYAIIPLFVIIGILQAIGLSSVLAQAIFFFLVLCVTGSSAVFFLRYLGVKYRIEENAWAIVVPSIFYMFNLFIAINAWRMLLFLYVFYAVLPLLLVWYLKYLDTEKIKYAIFCSLLTSAVVCVALTNLSFLFILFGFWFFLLLLHKSEKTILKLIQLFSQFLLIWIPLNSWYLLPQFSNISDSASKATGGGDTLGSLSILNVVSSHASLFNLLTVNGFYSFYDKIGGPWFSWSWLYTNAVFQVLGFILPLILLFVIFDKKLLSHLPRLYFFGIFLVLGGALLAKGSHAPWDEVFLYLFAHFPIPFLAFRAAYEKLGLLIVVGYMVTLYLFFSQNVILKNKNYLNIFGATSIFIILLIAFPLWTGKIFDSNNGIRTSSHIVIPEDYYQVAQILKTDSYALTLSLPVQPHTWISSKWDNGRQGYLGNDILRQLSHTPMISTDVGNLALDKFNQTIEADFTNSGVDTVNLVARQIKYIVVRKDINYDWALAYGKTMRPTSDFIESIEKSGEFEKRFDSKNLALYEFVSVAPHSYINAQDTLINFDHVDDSRANQEFASSSLHISSYIFSHDASSTIPSTNVRSLFSNLQPENLDDVNDTISNIPLFLSKNDSTLYKLFSVPNIRVDYSKTAVTFYAVDPDRISIGSTTPVFPTMGESNTVSMSRSLNSKYFLQLADGAVINVSAKDSIVVPNYSGANTFDVIETGTNIANPPAKSTASYVAVGDCMKLDDNPHGLLDILKHEVPKYTADAIPQTQGACVHIPVSWSGPGKYLLTYDYIDSVNSEATGRSQYTKIIDISTQYPEGNSASLKQNLKYYSNVNIQKIKNITKLKFPVLKSNQAAEIKNLSGSVSSTYYGNAAEFDTKQIVNWDTTVHDCGDTGNEKNISLDVKDSDKGEKIIKLTSAGHFACTFSSFELIGGASYLLNYQYRASSMNSAGYYLEFDDPAHTVMSKSLRQSSGSLWNSESLDLTVPAGARAARLYVYAFNPSTGVPNVSEYKNVQLEKHPNIKNKYYITQETNTKIQVPKNISFTTINPSNQEVNVFEGLHPFYLVMNTTFNPGWKVYLGNKTIEENLHFIVNTYTNGWYIDVQKICSDTENIRRGICTKNTYGSYNMKFNIKYQPQQWFYVGLLVSGSTLALCLGYLGYAAVNGRQGLRERRARRRARVHPTSAGDV